MTRSHGQINMSPDEKELHERIDILSSQVSKLEETKKDYDKKLADHAIHSTEFEKFQVLYNELLKDIEIKKSLSTTLAVEVNDLSNKKFLANKECLDLDVIVDQKKAFVADIEKYSEMSKILQKEMEDFQNEHANNKKAALKDLEMIKNQIKDLHSLIGDVVSKV
jgi:hypothetical protein